MEQIKELLNKVFGDSPAYLDALEKSGFLDKNEAFALYEDDRPISVLFVKKYPLNLASRIGWADYIFYAATSPDHRRRGLMSKLLSETLSTLKKRGGDCAVLIPAEKSLFDFYSNCGFKTSFFVKQQEFLPDNNGKCIYVPSENESKKFYPRYFEKYGKRQNTVFKTEEIFRQSVSEHLFDKTSSAIVSDGEDIAFASLGDKIILREYTGNDVSSFSKAVAHKYQKPVVSVLPTDRADIPLGMVYWYNENKENPFLYMDNMLN